jgi:hypothetical protein
MRSALVFLLPLCALAQSNCPPANFLVARTVSLIPSDTSHIDVVRQEDGSYTGFEVTNEAPYRMLAVTQHFEQQFAACLPHTIPVSPSLTPPIVNAPGTGSQLQVATAVGAGNYFTAHIGAHQLTVYFDIFDSQHTLVSEKVFTSTDAFQSLVLADLNGDGNLDMTAVFDTSQFNVGGVWTFLGKGDGTFQTGTRQVLTQGPYSPWPVKTVAVAI